MRDSWLKLMTGLHAPDGGAGGGDGSGGGAEQTGNNPGADGSTTTGSGGAAGDNTGTAGGKKPVEFSPEQQSELDRRVNEAVQKREAALRAEAERKQAESNKEFEDLYKTEKSQRETLELREQTRTELNKSGLGDLAPVFDGDLSTLDGRVGAAKAVQKVIDARVDAIVRERLKNDPPPKNGGGAGSGGKYTAEEINGMTQEQYEKARSEGRI